MRYIIDRKTNEHERYDGQSYDATKYRIVEADSDGWIPHAGTECPLPDDCMVDTMWDDGQGAPRMAAGHWRWRDPSITHYRPILAEKMQEPEPTKPKRLFDDLLERLEASHAAAQALPDLVEQLRDRLKPLGLSVMYLSEFDVVEPEPAIETPQEDMSDWRNWRDNDLIMLKDGIKSGNAIIAGEKYQITHKTKDGFWIDTKMQGSIHIMGRVGDFRFHSRPKGEK